MYLLASGFMGTLFATYRCAVAKLDRFKNVKKCLGGLARKNQALSMSCGVLDIESQIDCGK